MSRGPNPFPSLWSGTQYIGNTLNGHLTTCWDGELTTLQWPSSSQLPKIKINGSDELESRAQRGGVLRQPLVCVCVYVSGWGPQPALPAAGGSPALGELPWELRVWEGARNALP